MFYSKGGHDTFHFYVAGQHDRIWDLRTRTGNGSQEKSLSITSGPLNCLYVWEESATLESTKTAVRSFAQKFVIVVLNVNYSFITLYFVYEGIKKRKRVLSWRLRVFTQRP